MEFEFDNKIGKIFIAIKTFYTLYNSDNNTYIKIPKHSKYIIRRSLGYYVLRPVDPMLSVTYIKDKHLRTYRATNFYTTVEKFDIDYKQIKNFKTELEYKLDTLINES